MQKFHLISNINLVFFSFTTTNNNLFSQSLLEVTDRNRKQREIIIDDHCDT
jgi:hypothetical protein